MCKTYAEVAMEVIREDWELRKEQNNPVFNQERIAQMMGISRSQLAKALTTDKNPTISFICSYATAVPELFEQPEKQRCNSDEDTAQNQKNSKHEKDG